MTGKSHRTIGNLRVFTGTQDLKKNRAEILAFANEKDLGRVEFVEETASGRTAWRVNRHSTVTHYQRPNMTHPQEGGTGGEVSEILFFSAKSKRHPSLIYSMQIIPVCLSIVARRKGVSATRRGGLNWTPISLLVGHPCKLFHSLGFAPKRPAIPYTCMFYSSIKVHRNPTCRFSCLHTQGASGSGT